MVLTSDCCQTSAPVGIAVTDIARELVSELRYLNASGNGKAEVVRLPIARGTLASAGMAIADDLDAIIVCSDLQGVVPNQQTRLSEPLGVALAEHLAVLAAEGMALVVPRKACTEVVSIFSVGGGVK